MACARFVIWTVPATLAATAGGVAGGPSALVASVGVGLEEHSVAQLLVLWLSGIVGAAFVFGQLSTPRLAMSTVLAGALTFPLTIGVALLYLASARIETTSYGLIVFLAPLVGLAFARSIMRPVDAAVDGWFRAQLASPDSVELPTPDSATGLFGYAAATCGVVSIAAAIASLWVFFKSADADVTVRISPSLVGVMLASATLAILWGSISWPTVRKGQSFAMVGLALGLVAIPLTQIAVVLANLFASFSPGA